MDIVGMAEMQAVFAVTDELGLSREALVVPLLPEGRGSVARQTDGRFRVILPAEGDLEGFLERLPAELETAGAALG